MPQVEPLVIPGLANVPPPPYPGAAHNQYDLTPTPYAVNRPRLPEARRNPLLHTLTPDDTIVKFQTIVRDDTEIVVGRIKVPIPGANTHAFILRRYDTNSVSLTTMFKVAFPGASEDEEKIEMEWVKASFDTSNTNGGRGSDTVKLAGQWVTRHLAIHLAPAYGIADLIAILARANPDPNVMYRKSQRSQAAADELARGRSGPTDTPAPKRTRRTPPSEDRIVTLEATTTVTVPTGAAVDMEAEIESAKQLVLNLKRELRLKAAAGESLEEQGFDVNETRGVKRVANEEYVEVSGSGGQRVIAKSKRVEVAQSTATRFAWGAVIFGLGAAATAFLPQLASNFL